MLVAGNSKMGCIYKITNTVNGKSYIGQTRHDVEKTRIRKHPRRVFYGLPETLTLQEKRKILFSQFTEVTKRTIYNWVGKWTSIS